MKILNLSTVPAKLITAATAFIELQDRTTNPAGSFDSKRRFWLDKTCECCRSIRTPSAAFPYSQMLHGRTAKHVAAQHGVDEALLKRVAKVLKNQ